MVDLTGIVVEIFLTTDEVIGMLVELILTDELIEELIARDVTDVRVDTAREEVLRTGTTVLEKCCEDKTDV